MRSNCTPCGGKPSLIRDCFKSRSSPPQGREQIQFKADSFIVRRPRLWNASPARHGDKLTAEEAAARPSVPQAVRLVHSAARFSRGQLTSIRRAVTRNSTAILPLTVLAGEIAVQAISAELFRQDLARRDMKVAAAPASVLEARWRHHEGREAAWPWLDEKIR